MKKGSSPGRREVCSQNQARSAWLHVVALSVPHTARPLGTAGDWSDSPLLLAVSPSPLSEQSPSGSHSLIKV